MERERERENQRVMDDEVIEYSPSHGEVMLTGPTRSDFSVVVGSEFPRQIQNHPFHPSHPLFLGKGNGGNQCHSCGVYCSTDLFYRCELCNFDLDTNCAKLIPTIKYLGHPDHLLSLHNIHYSHFEYRCNACRNQCRGHFLRCVPCNFNLHVDCLPHKVKHKNHRHFFTLTTSVKEEDRGLNELVCFECDAKINPDEPVYYCAKCCYPLHCLLLREWFGSDHSTSHTSNPRWFIVICKAIADHDESGQVLVGVGKDMVKLMNDVEMKTTPKFPIKIKHPFHSQQPLTLTVGQSHCVYYNCFVCMKHNDGFRYQCFECDLCLDLNCVLRKPTIKYDGHQKHLLIFLKKIFGNYSYNICRGCEQSCKTSPILRCANCNFNLHIDCFPALPHTFKNPQCHLHTLTLTDSFAGDLSVDEFYCDFCEDERDPRFPVYYCEECPFVAHVTCVLYEELPSIIAELDSTKRDGGVEESVFVDVSNDKFEDEVAKIDVEKRELQLKSEKFCAKQRELQLRLKELEEELGEIEVKQKELKDKRAQYLASVS